MKQGYISVKGGIPLKVAASDFDGTLFIDNTICPENVEGVRKWRAAGNKFGVVTGRDYGMLVPQLDYFGISYDFAVCNNGAIIFGENGKVLYQAEIPEQALYVVATHPCVADSLHVAFSQAERSCIYREREGSWMVREAKQWQFLLKMIEIAEIHELSRVHQIALGFASLDGAAEAARQINLLFGDTVYACQNRGSVDITPIGIDKSKGIEKLLELKAWQDAEVHVIGDEINDLPMMHKFNGYAVESARAVIKREVKRSFASVGSMLQNNL
ncbi:MAG: HAD-superfamily hydrolase, subfamily [Massilibacillus sp.]|jgi:Cof subfamily protein (haloacid dehalogenase superfamily)|nr:HAD-superfamily hydrolase, subfamily [Massilibacillus sp.]